GPVGGVVHAHMMPLL
nr:mAb 8C7-reactive major allergen {N-terminal, band 2} [Parietaria officinalis, pollen, Peptide Partial, 15 aa] [Parietaria officinalis]